jgi:hypothetical protein
VPTPPPVAAPPPPPLKTEPMFDRLETYAHDHPVEGVTSIKRGVSTEGDDALSGTVSYFAQGAEIYRADFNAQGDLIHAGQTPSGRARDMMKRFKFGRPGGDHGITAEALGKTSSGGEYIRHVSFTDDNGDFRGFMDFDQDGNLQRGIVYGEDGHVEARWDGPPDAPPAAAPKLPDLDQLNEDLDREDAEQRADDLKAWREEYPPEPAVAP